MKKQFVNPFKFGDPVDGEYFLPRPELAHVVSQFLEGRIHVVLIGPRRFGKTSFVLNLLKEFEKKSFAYLFVDIFNITSHHDFLHQILRALKLKKNWKEHIKHWGKSLTNLRPKVSTDLDSTKGQSSISLSFDVSPQRDVKELIQDVLNELEKLGSRDIIAIDEFQKVTEIEDGGWLEGTLRTHMQQMRNTSFLFTGSRRSIIYDMLNNHTKPFYRSCQPMEFPSFGHEFTDWILERFLEVGIHCKREAIEHLRGLVQDTPNYVQMACFHLVAQRVERVGLKEVDATLTTIVQQNAYAYQTLLNTLSPTQQRVLRLAANETKQVFSKELMTKYEITSGPALASSIKALKNKGILDEEGTGRGRIIFEDPLFAIWLKLI
jgi:hypothetical protein